MTNKPHPAVPHLSATTTATGMECSCIADHVLAMSIEQAHPHDRIRAAVAAVKADGELAHPMRVAEVLRELERPN